MWQSEALAVIKLDTRAAASDKTLTRTETQAAEKARFEEPADRCQKQNYGVWLNTTWSSYMNLWPCVIAKQPLSEVKTHVLSCYPPPAHTHVHVHLPGAD